MKAPIGSSALSGSIVPSVTGASASAGVSSASYCATHWISARPTPCSWNSAISASTELMDLHREKSAQLSGSMSSAVASRPMIISASRICVDTAGPKEAVKTADSSGCAHGGSASTTSWPSDSSSAAASWTAWMATGSIGASGTGESVDIAMRSRPGARPAEVANGSAGGGAQVMSPSSTPARMSSTSAVSRTLRVRTPSWTRNVCPTSGAIEMRPRWGLSPTRPQQAAGIRIEPPPSLAWAIGTIPAATAAADPPDEPPVVRDWSHGLRVAPKRRVSVVGRMPHSGSVVVPTMMKPAALRRATTLWSYGARKSPMNSAAKVSRLPLTARLFLMAIGTPANGRGSPAPTLSASASASSAKTSTNALSVGLSSAMRSSEVCTSSRAESWPERTSAASSWTGRKRRSAPAAVDMEPTITGSGADAHLSPGRNHMTSYHGVMPDRDLPEDLVLPLATGEPWWYWSGGRPAVDFVNTRRERWRRGVETLVTPEDLATWLVRAGVMDASALVTRKVLAQAVDLREAIDTLLVGAIDGTPVASTEAITLIDDWLVFAGVRPQLVAGDGRRAAADRARRRRLAAPRAGHDRAGRRDDARHRPALADPDLRERDLQRALLRPLAGRPAPLVLDAHLRQRGQGPAPPPAPAPGRLIFTSPSTSTATGARE